MTNAYYKHHFTELCDRLNYNTVIFVKETGLILAMKDMRTPKRDLPNFCALSFNYDSLPKENSKVFYGLNLSLGNQTIICSGSVSVIDIQDEHLVIVFFEPRISNFRDNQLPRIMWKDLESRYLGHSDYVPMENGVSHSIIGYTDSDLYDPVVREEYRDADEAIFKNGTCFWDQIGKIKVNLFTSLVKLEKFPFYSKSNELLGAVLIYQPLNQSGIPDVPVAESTVPVNQVLINRLLSAANIYIAVQNQDSEPKVENYSNNFSKLGYDFEMFASGKISMKDIVYPGDYDRYLREVNEKLYQKKESFSTNIRVVTAHQEIIPAKAFFTPHLGEDGKILKIAALIDCYDPNDEKTQNFEMIMVAINRMHTVYTVRKAATPSVYQIISENFHQFGFQVSDLISGKIRFIDLIHPEDRNDYTAAIESILSHRVLQTICEYRLVSKKNIVFWIRETMFTTTVRGVEYLETAILNITSTKQASESLQKIYQMENPQVSHNAVVSENFNFGTALMYSNVKEMLEKYSASLNIDIMLLNNYGTPLMDSAIKSKGYDVVIKQLIDFSSFAVNEAPVCMYENLFVRAFPITHIDNRIGTLVLYGLITDLFSWPGSRVFSDPEHLFHHFKRVMIPEILRNGQIIADSVGSVAFSAAVTVMQIQSSANFAGDLNRQKQSHGIILELLNIANRTDDVEQCFHQMIPKIGEAFTLTRGSMFQYAAEQDDYSLISEWFVEGESERKKQFQNLKLSDTFYANWEYEKNVSFVVNSDDLVPDKKHFREFARAIVGVRLSNKDQVYGFLNFVDNFQNRKWTADEVMMFEDVGYILSSVIERNANKEAITHNMEEYMRSMDSMPAAIALIDRETSAYQFANQKFWELVSSASGRASREQTELNQIIHRVLLVADSKNAEKNIHFPEQDKWFLIDRSDISFESGKDSVMLILTDITQNRKTQETMSALAFTDVLTGLPNRIKFEIEVKKIYENPSVDLSNCLVMHLNIDNFKMINNTFSYAIGDELLKAIAKQMRLIPEITGHLFRFGGDEFCVLIDSPQQVSIYDLANTVMQIFEKPFFIDGYETSCTVSMGIVYLSDAEQGINDLIRKSNISLKDAKLSGKNRYVLYDLSLKKYEEDTDLLERALKIAIDDGCAEFEVFYQPIISAKTGKIVSSEALVRWFSKEYGIVSPVKFIPIAEATGLIVPLGKFILNSACKEAKKWLDYGYDLCFSVNFSVLQTLQSDLVESVRSTLNTYHIPPKKLIFEVTESLAINDINKVIEILSSVRDIGIRIAMDDFGTGYSSLNHLRRLPLDIVKIDRSFIFNIEYDPYTVSFVDTITKFCHMRNSEVCCEGVETETQKAILSSIEVDSLQGYLFGKPCTADDFWKLLINGHK